jgi:hypothetical protein
MGRVRSDHGNAAAIPTVEGLSESSKRVVTGSGGVGVCDERASSGRAGRSWPERPTLALTDFLNSPEFAADDADRGVARKRAGAESAHAFRREDCGETTQQV